MAAGAGPELFIGLVSPVGTDLTPVVRAFSDAFRAVEYVSGDEIRLSELLHEIDRWSGLPSLGKVPEDERIELHMKAGSEFRDALKRGDALAAWSIGAIREERAATTGDVTKPAPRRAYILRSLKHPAEAVMYRRLYGPAFILVSAYSPRARRVDSLSRLIAESHHAVNARDYRAHAETLLQKDEAELAGC